MEKGYLVLDRYIGQKVMIGNDIEVTITKINKMNNSARITFVVPKNITIMRGEIFESKKGNQ